VENLHNEESGTIRQWIAAVIHSFVPARVTGQDGIPKYTSTLE
jgi:hypothetical protein